MNSDLICGVCSAPAHGYNFDQITCESCKAFFRRNALKNTVRPPPPGLILTSFFSFSHNGSVDMLVHVKSVWLHVVNVLFVD